MKQLLILLALFTFTLNTCYSQLSVKRDSSGRYVSSSKLSVKAKANAIGIYRDKNGNEYPMYKSTTGKVYIIRVSKKTGNEYRQYITIEQ